MINWLLNRKRKKEVRILESIIVEKLGDFQPNIKEIYKYADLVVIHPVTTNKPFLLLQHSIDETYLSKNRKKHNCNYIINGIEIQKTHTPEFIEIPIQFSGDLINTIHIDTPEDFWKHYNIDSIRTNKLSRTEIELRNVDKEKLNKILTSLDTEQIKKLETDDTIEIELDKMILYTILDMNDGNYIAVDSKKKVYRLNHDNQNPVLLIDNSIENFSREFSGDKKDLNKYFDN
jgi:hypothetical protein